MSLLRRWRKGVEQRKLKKISGPKTVLGKRLDFLLAVVGKVVTSAIRFLSPESETAGATGRLLIEAGELGWKEPAPGLLEIEQSAREYLGDENVFRLEVPKRPKSYIRLVLKRVSEVRPSHYFYDTRTGSQNPFFGLLQAFAVLVVLTWFRTTPITILTNFPARRWRRQVSVLTAARGLILVLIGSEDARAWLPHDRVLGPIFMPFSRFHLHQVRRDFSRPSPKANRRIVTFIGSVYEPRKTQLDDIGQVLEDIGVEFVRHERSPKDPKIGRLRYWRVLREAPIVLTTADHIIKKTADLGFPPHMVYRYTEALVAEACLIAPEMPSPLIPWVHFVPLGEVENLHTIFERLFASEGLAEEISRNGSKLIANRIENDLWWAEIDATLLRFQQRTLRGLERAG